MYLASGLPNTASGKDPRKKRSMAPTMPVSAPLAGGSKSAIAVCGATRCRRMPCASVACWPGVATSSIRRMEPIWQDSCSKQALPGILTAWSCLTSRYQLSNDHLRGAVYSTTISTAIALIGFALLIVVLLGILWLVRGQHSKRVSVRTDTNDED